MRARAFTFMAALLAVLVTASSVAAQPQPLLPLPAFALVMERCRSLGKPFAGRLVNGTRLPAEGRDFFTWDPIGGSPAAHRGATAATAMKNWTAPAARAVAGGAAVRDR